MPAHGSPQDAHVVSRPEAAGDHFALQNHPLAQRVVSVSPHAHATPQHPIKALFDQKVLEEGRAIAESLLAQREQTESLIENLSALAAKASEGEAQAAQAVVHLQDRLRLSAQMLKAFQSQIGRIDHSLEQLKAQERRAEAAEGKAQQRLTELNARIDAALADFTQRLEQVMHAAQEKMNQLVVERAADAVARSSNFRAPPAAAVPGDVLVELAATMRDVSQRLAAMTSQVAVAPSNSIASAPAMPAESARDAEITITAPLKLHSWASRA